MEPKDLWAYPINISGSEYSGKNPMPAREMLSNAAKFSMYNHNFMRYRLPAAVAEMVAGAQDPAVFAKAVAAELRDDLEALTEAVRDSGAGATAQQIVDEFVRRLVDQPQGQE